MRIAASELPIEVLDGHHVESVRTGGCVRRSGLLLCVVDGDLSWGDLLRRLNSLVEIRDAVHGTIDNLVDFLEDFLGIAAHRNDALGLRFCDHILLRIEGILRWRKHSVN